MVLRIILGGLYVAMGLGQLASWSAMPGILAAYGAAPAGMAPLVAIVLIGAELFAGVWLLARPRSHRLVPVWVFAAVAVFWTALGAQAYVRGLAVDDCGCFGRYLSQSLSWLTLSQDGLLLLYAVLMVRGGLRASRTASGGADRDKDGGKAMSVRAMWNGVVLADSDDTVVVEGNHYFPPESVNWQHLQESPTRTVCPWKGVASYHTVVVDGASNQDAAWFYPHPSPLARRVENRIAFWRGVRVETVADAPDGQG